MADPGALTWVRTDDLSMMFAGPVECRVWRRHVDDERIAGWAWQVLDAAGVSIRGYAPTREAGEQSALEVLAR